MSNLGGFEKFLRVGEGRRRKRLAEQAAYVASLEPDFEKLSDAELARQDRRVPAAARERRGPRELLFEAYAAVREAFKRAMGIRLFDVQVMGGIVLHEGDIAEMKTGEGKTFVATQPLYLNSLPGKNVHLVTVNDYLAKRDAEWVGPVYEALGHPRRGDREHDAAGRAPRGLRRRHHLRHELRVRLRLPARQHGRPARGHRPARPHLRDRGRGRLDPHRRGAHAADHLRRARGRGEGVLRLRAHREAARGPAGDAGRHRQGHGRARRDGRGLPLRREAQDRSPGPAAIERVERELGIDNLYDPRNVQLVNHLNQALRAQALYQRDVDYVIQDGEVKIVDEFTGRIMEGRPLVGGAAPGGRGEGGRARSRRSTSRSRRSRSRTTSASTRSSPA